MDGEERNPDRLILVFRELERVLSMLPFNASAVSLHLLNTIHEEYNSLRRRLSEVEQALEADRER